jgi:hypothetical protein
MHAWLLQGYACAMHISVDTAQLRVTSGDANQLIELLPLEDAVVPRARVFLQLAQALKSNLVKVMQTFPSLISILRQNARCASKSVS